MINVHANFMMLREIIPQGDYNVLLIFEDECMDEDEYMNDVGDIRITVDNSELLDILYQVKKQCESLDLIYPTNIKRKDEERR